MALTCPNKNTQEWKDLVASVGEVKAMLAFTLNGEVVPTVEQVNNKTSESTEDLQSLIQQLYRGELSEKQYAEKVLSTYGQPKETKSRAMQKYELLRRFVPSNVNIIFRNDLPTVGKMAKSEGSYTIIINPLLLESDAVGHEFGHILLYLMNGMQNPLVKQARDLLRDSKIEKFVLENYKSKYDSIPELYDLEIVAWALGHDVSKEIDNEEKRNKLQRLLHRIYEWFRTKLGIERSAIQKLSRMMLSGKVITDKWETRKEEYEAEKPIEAEMGIFGKKREKKKEEDIDTTLDRLNKESTENKLSTLVGDAIEVLERKLKIYKTGGKVSLNSIKTALKDIKSAEDPEKALYHFVRFAYNATNTVYKDYLQKKHNNKITIKALDQWKTYISGFKEIDRIMALLIEDLNKRRAVDEASVKNKKSTSILSDEAFRIMKDIISRKNIIENRYIIEGSKILADYLAPYHRHLELRKKEQLQIEYNTLSKEQKMSETMEEYVDKKMAENATRIQTASRKDIYQEILKAGRDINVMTRWLDTIIDSSDPVVAAMARTFYEQDIKSMHESNEVYKQMVEMIQDLETFFKAKGGVSTDPKKIYDFMLEKNKKGEYTGYLLSEIRGGFDDELRRQIEELKKDPSITDVEVRQFVKKYRKSNGTMDWASYENNLIKFVESLQDPNDPRKFPPVKVDMFKRWLRANQNKWAYQYFATEDEDIKNEMNLSMEEVIEDFEISEKIQEWIYENKSKFYTVNERWINNSKEYKELQNILKNPEDPRTKFYKFIVDNTHSMQRLVPYSQRIELRIPSVLKSPEEYVAEGKLKEAAKVKLQRTFNVTQADQEERETQERIRLTDETGKPVEFLPVYYNQDITDDKGILKDDISLDLGTSFFKFFRMAIDYKYKKEILPQMEMARFFVNNRQYIEIDKYGNPYLDALDPDKKRESTTKDNSNLANQLNDWFKSVFYGQRKAEEGIIPGLNIDFAKGIDALNSYTAINMLGLNVIQGAANAMLGHANNWIESFGGINYSAKDFGKADVYYTRHLVSTLSDIGQRKPSGVINLLNEQFDTLHDYERHQLRDNNLFKTLFRTDALFATTHLGEHMIQTKVMLAMLNHMPAYNKSGQRIGTVLDQYKVSKEKRLSFKEEFDPIKSKWTEKDQIDFQIRLSRLLADMHGDYYRNSIPAYQRLALGRMAGLFRKFVVPGFKRRWDSKHPDSMRGTMLEGYYLTFGRFVGNLVKHLVRFKGQLASEDWTKLSPMERANVHKALGELAFLIASIGLTYVFTSMGSDDDDEGWIIDFASYQSYRFMAEMSFFFNPVQTMNILRSPAASITMVENAIQLLGQFLDFPGGSFMERFDKGNWKGHLKIEKYATNLLAPGYKQWYRLKYIEDQIGWFK